MKDDTIKLVAAAALGIAGGLVLGLYIWGSEESKRKFSIPVDKLIALVKELDEKDALTAENIKQTITNLFDKTEKKTEKDIEENTEKKKTNE
jgi:hypothetical protein